VKVLHVIPSIAASDGGPTAALQGMVDGIAQRGATVTVATTALAGTDVEQHDGVTIMHFPRSLPGSWKYSRPLGEWLRANIPNFDIVHVHALFSYATIPACRSAMTHGVPLIIRPLGTLDPWSLARRGWKKRPYLRLVETRHLRGASAIHVTSELERRSLENLGYGRKARVIPLGVDRVWSADEVESRAGRHGALRVLFLSRLHPKKGLALLIAALGGLRDRVDFSLRIAGAGEEAYVKKLTRLCDKAGIAERVSFAGHVAGREKEDMLHWADVFVLPSYQENFSIAAVEAMAAGLPVVLSNNVGVSPDASAAGAGVVVAMTASALGSAIVELSGDANLRMRMGRSGRALAENRFTWAAASDSLLDLYGELRAMPRGPARFDR
jgi:glycosyltransferase involved in cell wall biosynthesis